MRKLVIIPLCLVLGLIVENRMIAQQNNNYLYAVGNQPFSTQIPIENGFINVNNGDIHIEIPLAQTAQRGNLQLNERLVYDSRIWKILANGGYSWSPTNVPNSMGGWTFQSGQTTGNVAPNTGNVTTFTCGPPPSPYPTYTQTLNAYEWTDPSGTVHPFTGVWTEIVASDGSTGSVCGTSTGPSQKQVSGTALDASGYSILLVGTYSAPPTSITVYDRGGNEVYPVVADTNGNSFGSDSNGNLVDTLGRTPVLKSTSGNKIFYDVLTFNGARARYTVTTETVSYHTAFNQTAVTDVSGSFTAIQSIELPDNTTYSFSYDSGTAAGNYGEVTGVTLPAGGAITYGYANFLDSFQNQNRWIHTRAKDGGTTTFTPKTISNCSGSVGCKEQVTATSPAGNDTVYTFTLDQGSYYNASSWNTGIDVWQGSSTSGGSKLTSQATSYTYSVGTYQPNSSISEAFETPQTITTTTTLSDVNLSSKTLTTLDANGVNPVSVQLWDYYSGSAPASSTRTTTYAYNSYVNYAYLLTQATVKDGSGNQLSQTTSVRDARGNVTSTSQWLNTTGGTLSSSGQYGSSGSLLNGTDPTGTTTYGYDTTNTYVTSITPPTPSSGIALPSSSTYDASTGLLLTTTDPNGSQTVYGSYDYYGRAGEVDTLDSAGNMVGKQTATYTSTQSSVHQYQTSSQYADTETLYDSYGRTSRSAVANGQSGNTWYQRDTCYDSSGRLHFQSYAYQGAGWSTPQVCSGAGDTYAYDALGRVKTIGHGDGSSISYSYVGRATQMTDENAVSRITQVDGLGRVTIVCEISSVSLQGVAPVSCGTDITGRTGFVTTYAYTIDGSANQVTTITQGAQTRISKTDSLGRTVYTSEPERGVTTYGYAYSSTAGLGLTVTRTRPRANPGNAGLTTVTTTQYDAVGRVTSVTYTDGLTPNKTFGYDKNCCWGQAPTNMKGRLVSMGAILGSSSATWSGSLFSYDATGRVVSLWSCTPSTCGTSAQGTTALSFDYDWTGNLITEFDAVSGQINYARSVAGEVTSITNQNYSLSGSSGSATLASLVSNVQNGPNGPISYTLGNGLSIYNGYDTLGRHNAGWVCTGAATSNCSTQIYGNDVAWYGTRATAMNDTVIGAEANFGYDQFNRLSSTQYNYFNGQQINYGYTYDRYGNRLGQTAPQGGNTFSATFSATNNQILAEQYNYDPSASGYAYDAAGNMTNDAFHTYTYDAEGNILKVDGGNTASYVYDALNRRVRSSTSASSYEYLYDYAGRRTSSWLLNTPGYPAGFGNEGRIYWDGQQIAYRAYDGTTYFDHQDWLGTERLRTNYQGQVAQKFGSLPWGDGSFYGYGGTGPVQDTLAFAGLDFDNESGTDHAQFRNYSPAQGRWLSPDPYDGSYDLTNPQSLNRYAYVLNNPLTFTDPSGQAVCLSCSGWWDDGGDDGEGDDGGGDGGGGGGGGILSWLIGLFSKPSFHGTITPRPDSPGTPDWGNDPGSFGESLGLPQNIKITPNIAGAFGLPDAGCEFGACGNSLANSEQQTRAQLQMAYLEATAGRIAGLVNIFHNSTGKYDFGWNAHSEDTWTLCGITMNADQMGNFIAGFEGAAYDRNFFWTTGAIWAQAGVEGGGILYHLGGVTKSTDDPFDRTGMPDIRRGEQLGWNWHGANTSCGVH